MHIHKSGHNKRKIIMFPTQYASSSSCICNVRNEMKTRPISNILKTRIVHEKQKGFVAHKLIFMAIPQPQTTLKCGLCAQFMIKKMSWRNSTTEMWWCNKHGTNTIHQWQLSINHQNSLLKIKHFEWSAWNVFQHLNSTHICWWFVIVFVFSFTCDSSKRGALMTEPLVCGTQISKPFCFYIVSAS